MARLALSALRRASSELSLACSSSAISESFSAWNEMLRAAERVQALDDDQEIADDADRQRHRRRRRALQARGVEHDDAGDHRQHARDVGRRNGRGQQRHHRRNEQQDENGEGLRVRLSGPQERDHEIGPGRAAERRREHELAPPCARRRFGVDALQERDRERVNERDGAADEGRPGRQRRPL